jgi:hypothetical protein
MAIFEILFVVINQLLKKAMKGKTSPSLMELSKSENKCH